MHRDLIGKLALRATVLTLVVVNALVFTGCTKRTQMDSSLEAARERLLAGVGVSALGPQRLTLTDEETTPNRVILSFESPIPDQDAYVAFNAWIRPGVSPFIVQAEAERAQPEDPNIDLKAMATVTIDRLSDGTISTWVRADYFAWMRRETRSYTVRLRPLENHLTAMMSP